MCPMSDESPRRREWGEGAPLIALHPLGLDSRAFESIGRVLAASGFRTIAIDLPGFGGTPSGGVALTPAYLAQSVIDVAAGLESAPVVMGISMGGRVALEVGLAAPDVVRSVIAVAPYLPWLEWRQLLSFGRFMNPDRADSIPLERFWSTLKGFADAVENVPYLKDDAVARGGVRLIYQLSCPATRWSFISAAREMAIDPAFGERGFWKRLPDIAVPAAFIWGARDRLVSAGWSERVEMYLPSAEQRVLRCVAHALNGGHHRCLADAIAALLLGEHTPSCRGATTA